MKKTISIHIMGSNFLMEEDAYEKLSSYLNRLKQSLGNSTDGKEIYEDVELRIAELASQKISDRKQVIVLEEIDEIIQKLGEPEEYIETGEQDTSEKTEQHTESTRERRLFRDTKGESIAGVCAGIAAYFNIDVVIVRILFVLFAIFGGFGVTLYIILWIVIPSAKTTKDRLQMQGIPVTIENLKEELENAGQKLKKSGKRFEQEISDKNSPIRQRIAAISRVLSIIFGIGFFAFACVLLFSLVFGNVFDISIFPINTNGVNASIHELSELVFVDANNQFYTWLSGNLLVLTVGISSLLFSIRLLFGIRKSWFRILNISLVLFVIVNVSVLTYQGIKIGSDYTIYGQTEKYIGEVSDSVLIIKALPNTLNKDEDFILLDGQKIVHDGVDFQYKASEDSLFHVYAFYSARGNNRKIAKERSRGIEHEIKIENNVLSLSPLYSFDKKHKIRNQRIEIHVYIPKDSKVMFQNSIIDSNNLSDTGTLEDDGIYDHDRYH
jgi:phage shock protein PspC (stress-responsive transcriptional regulator)